MAALAAYTGHTLRNLYVLDRVLDGGKRRMPLFETRGLWAEIFARVDKLRVKARNRKRKYHRLLREVRESTGALSDGGIILNADHEILWFNPAASRLLGLVPAADIGHRIDNLLRHPDFVAYLSAPTGDGISVPSPLQRLGLARTADHPVRQRSAARDHPRHHPRECSSSARAAISSRTHRTSCARRSPSSMATSIRSPTTSELPRAGAARSPRCCARRTA